jgi:hypothetical protein
MPPLRYASIEATGILSPRMHGLPKHFSGSIVIRSNSWCRISIRLVLPRYWRIPAALRVCEAPRQKPVASVAYPSASGPRLSPCSISRSWVALSLGLRPAPPAFFKPARLDRASCRAQQITDCRWAPKRPATSFWLTPCSATALPASAAVPGHRAPAAHPPDYSCQPAPIYLSIYVMPESISPPSVLADSSLGS